ncbi:PKD domain-containing protein [Nafulsella turpanensis]|uniref:PKD domain-containing protein n=1 Tax=Nafulsella turpanensis TaxID=1265690 RepID=UPI00034DF129|nr:T9SS type A sorting domain-containing protein [Nafulsella turpanensis]
MKKFTHPKVRHPVFSTFLFYCFLCSFLSISTANAQLSGTYSIGSSGADYPGFNEAIRALEEEGISGPVTFQVQPGKYEEQLNLSSIGGNSCNFPIIFEGAGNDPEEVAIQSPSEFAFTVQINGVDGIRFRNLSIVGNIDVAPGTDCFQLEDNIIQGSLVAKSSAESRSNQHLYRNNLFQSGGGIFKDNEAPWDPNAPIFDQGLIIEGNSLAGGGITITGQADFKISRNSVNVSGQERDGISVTNSWYGLEISENSIGTSADNYKGTALLLNSAAAARITKNGIGFGDGGFAMDVSTGKSQDNEILIANNRLVVDGLDSRGHSHFDPISNLVGMDISSNYGNVVKLYHNSVQVMGQSEYVPNYALKLEGEDNSFHVLNNLFANTAFGGTGIIVDAPSAIAEMDYNSLYFEYTSLFASWNGQKIESLEEWQRVTGFGEHSISAFPGFPYTAPGEEMKGAGIYLAEVPTDIYGQERNNPPSIGAIEKELTQNPLSGIYTIGGEDPDFSSFAEAVEAISNSGGIEDSIILQVRPGEYSEQINIPNYGQEARIIIEGESGDRTDVVLKYPEGDVLEPEGDVLVLDGTSNLIFRNMTVDSGIRIEGGSDLLFENNIIHGGINASEVRQDTYRNNLFVGEGITIRGPGHVEQGGNPRFLTNLGLLIQENTFNVRSTAIDLFAEKDVVISGNIINIEQDDEGGGVTAISVDQSLDIKEIINNSIISNHLNSTGISVTGSFFAGDLPQEISRNRIVLEKGGTGINFNFDPGASSTAPALVANNMVSIHATNGGTGIAVNTPSGDMNFFHNSVNLYGSNADSKVVALDFDSEEPANVRFNNNIFSSSADGYVMVGAFSTGAEGVITSDFNNLFTTGETLAVWDENTVSNLDEWQALSGLDQHSLAVDPKFLSDVNLIPANSALAGAGTGLGEVQVDFFGHQRSYPPTIGAVEKVQTNQPPVVNAGRDKTVTLPLESLYLRGIGKDADSRFTAFLWEKLSGPSVSMSNFNTANALLQDLQPGEYVFRFSATDNEGATASDEMKLTVLSGNQPPVISIGKDKTVYLPLEKLLLSAVGHDPDGVFREFRWEKLRGPSVSMRQENTANLILTDLVEGSYLFRFTATDNAGASTSDEMMLTVQRRNQVPIVDAGGDRTIDMGYFQYQISGIGFDPDGVFRAFRWEKVSGPSVSMQQQNTANLILTDFEPGVYTFRFYATDNDGATAADEMKLTVNPEPAIAFQSYNIHVSAYPNTFQDHIHLTVQAAVAAEYQMEVYDMLGKVYYRGSFAGGLPNEQAHRIDLSDVNMRDGLYLIKIENRKYGFEEVVKVVKAW